MKERRSQGLGDGGESRTIAKRGVNLGGGWVPCNLPQGRKKVHKKKYQ